MTGMHRCLVGLIHQAIGFKKQMPQGEIEICIFYAAIPFDIDVDLIPRKNLERRLFAVFPINLGVKKDAVTEVQETGLCA